MKTAKKTRSWIAGSALAVAAGAGALGLGWMDGGGAVHSTEAESRRPTLAEATEAMKADGSLDKFVYTRNKLGKHVLPKHPGKAWEWFLERRVPGEKRLPNDYRQKAMEETLRKNVDRSSLRESGRVASWTPIAPGGAVQPSGRLIELAVHPSNDQIVYAASASGGLWKTTNLGGSWTNVTDGFIPTIGMGSVAIDPFNPETVYVGLGEGVPGSFYEPYGGGVYRSTNGGATWSMLPNTAGFNYVTDIEIGADSNTILVCARGLNNGSGGGFFRSTDGGNSWSNPSGTYNGYSYYDVSVETTNRNVVLVTEGQTNHPNGVDYSYIYRSTDNGASFSTTFPYTGVSNMNVFRVELARSGATVYALAALNSAQLAGVLKSTDGGATWGVLPLNGIPNMGDFAPGQMNYNCAIGANPANPNEVVMGSNLRMYRSLDGGFNFAPISDWAGQDGLPYMHADHHTVRFNASGTRLMVGNDGGFFHSSNVGTSWTEGNAGYNALQIYRMDNNRTNENVLIAGMQDNDKYMRLSDGSWFHYPNTWGDGMEMICYDPSPTTFLGTNYYGGATQITENNGANWFFFRGYGAQNNGIPDNERGGWISPFFNDPQNPNVFYLGLQNIYRCTYTPGFFPTWQQIIPLNPNFVPTTIESMTLSSGAGGPRKLIGFLGRQSQTGTAVQMFRANPDGTGYEDLSLPQNFWVNCVATDPNANGTVWIGYSNLATAQVQSIPRIFRSTDLGSTWQDMTNNFPSNLPVSAIWVDPNNSNTIVVGSDLGVYRSDNGGATWVFWNDGLPAVVVTDFAYYPPTRKLRVATYGRGVYETPLDAIVGSATAGEVRNFLLGAASQPAGADANNNGRVEVGDVVTLVNQGRP